MHDSFHPDSLKMHSPFRETLRFKPGFSTEHLDRAQGILQRALEKHGEEHLTRGNFDKISQSMRKDTHWERLHSQGPAFENALKAHLGIPHETESH